MVLTATPAPDKKPAMYGDSRLQSGGLMRCCIETIGNYIQEHFNEPIVNGLVIDCSYEQNDGGQIIIENDTWRWNHAT